jgi:hypothetical protein
MDDTLMFIEAKEEHAALVKEVLHKFKNGTDQQINPSKCSMMVGAGCESTDRGQIMEIVQVANIAQEEKYLGLPTPQGHMNKDTFKSTKERLPKRFSSWAERYMSLGAKEVLIKYVV